MQNCEQIVLDAWIEDVIEDSVFRARLANGHRIVAWMRDSKSNAARKQVGEAVRVRMSPYDMSKGMILEEDSDHEG